MGTHDQWRNKAQQLPAYHDLVIALNTDDHGGRLVIGMECCFANSFCSEQKRGTGGNVVI